MLPQYQTISRQMVRNNAHVFRFEICCKTSAHVSISCLDKQRWCHLSVMNRSSYWNKWYATTRSLACDHVKCQLRFLCVSILNQSPKTTISCWRHDMNFFLRNSSFVRGLHLSPVNSPSQSTSDADLCSYFWCTPEQTVDQAMMLPVIWEAMTLIMTLL